MKVYVSTYAKYNNGSLRGGWVELADCAGDMDAFFDACKTLHADETDPETMVQAWEDAPGHFARLEYVPQAALDFALLDDDDQALLAAYVDICGADVDASIDTARDYLMGTYDSERDAAETIVTEMLDESGLELPTWLVTDFQATWQCNLRHDYSSGESGGYFWVFSN